MGGIFGKNKKRSSPEPAVQVSQQDLAVLQLKQLRDKIKQSQKKTILQMDRDHELARKLVKDNKKDRALVLLKKRKRMETTLSNLDNRLDTLEQMVSDIEFAQVEMKVIDGLKTGNEALKSLNELLSIEKIEDILDETREAAEKTKEISDLLSGGLRSDMEQDDEDELLLQELEQMVSQGEVTLPQVPQDELTSVPIKKQTESTAPNKRVALEAA